MKKIKNFVSVFMCIIILCVSFSFDSFAVDEFNYGNYTYTVSAGKVTIVSYPEQAEGSVKIPSTIDGKTVVAIDDGAFQACTLITEVIVPDTVSSIGRYAFAYCVSLQSVTIPSSVSYIGENAFQNSKKVVIKCEEPSTALKYAFANGIDYEIVVLNIYNLGEETYSFENFSLCDSICNGGGGHCFGMSVTSSGYYIGSLSKTIIGGNDATPLYSFEDTSVVKAPICYYFNIQGPGPEQNSIVAGGNIDLYEIIDTSSDWTDCVNYVKNHEYDNSGRLQVGSWYSGEEGGGHAVNFLYYENVDGQDRIYVYDNNFPETETYYYMGDDGYIYQAPLQTSYRGIMGLDLMDVENYFSLAGEFEHSRYIYADKTEIYVENAKMYNMKCGADLGTSVMFEVPEETKQVKIIPLTDNATFSYLDETYSFEDITDQTVGLFTLSTSDENPEGVSFEITEEDRKISSVSVSDLKLNYKSSANISAEIDADEGVEYKVEYTSSNPKVASVDSNGKVYGAGKGSATITCTVTDNLGNSISDSCNVTVNYTWWQWLIKIALFGWIWY